MISEAIRVSAPLVAGDGVSAAPSAPTAPPSRVLGNYPASIEVDMRGQAPAIA